MAVDKVVEGVADKVVEGVADKVVGLMVAALAVGLVDL